MRERIGRYRILDVLGQGGMGVVYVAEDEVLQRRVAVKTVRPDLGDDTHRARLWREARAAAGLAHPNICQVFDVGEEDGDLYVAMELLEGEPLSTCLERGPLPLKKALEVVLDVLSALTALHDRGVIHRDLKPSNVFLTERGAKLLDFGLALPLAEEASRSSERLTQTGVVLGTPGFMAPEQWTSEEVGPRTDLFAAGALLVEMVTGAPAFQGDSPLAHYHALMHEPPPTLSGGPAVDALDLVVQRALARLPGERHASAKEMARDLRTIAPLVEGTETPTARGLRRVLVLPFEQPRPDADTELAALAIADSVLSALAGRSGLVLKAGATPVPAAEVAEAARAGAATLVVTGSILHAPPQLRVSARLLEMPESAVAWSESVTMDATAAFQAQEDLANRIAHAVAERTTGEVRGTIHALVPTDPDAYAFFLRANQLSFNVGLLGEARDLYESALQIDPQFAPAWARLGRVLRVQAKYGHGDVEADRKAAAAAFEKALALDPDLAVAHNYYAYYEIEELARPADAMRRLIEQARKAPTDPDLFAGLVTACRFCGLLEPSVEADRRARRLDPGMRTSVAYTHWMRADYAAALRHDDEDMRWMHHYARSLLGREAEALEGLRACEARVAPGIARDMLTCSRATLERDEAAALAAGRRVFDSGFNDPEGLYYMLRNMAFLGLVDVALDVFDRVVRGGLRCAASFRADPWLANLREDDRYDAILLRAEAGHAEALAVYREAGGDALLGRPATEVTREA